MWNWIRSLSVLLLSNVNGFDKNAIKFRVDNNSYANTDNKKKVILVVS